MSVRTTALLACLSLSACATVQPASAPPTGGHVRVGIIAINDFHGALEPPRASVAMPDAAGGTLLVPAGGAAWLASAISGIRAGYQNSVTVAAGDLTGASQLASSLYLDEPSIGVLNRIGLDFNAVGNHEFDRGWQELLRLQNGGCDQHTRRKPCQIERFAGARFRYLAASTTKANGQTLFPATGIKRFGKGKLQVSLGFIGLTLKETPPLVMPEATRGLTFGDEADAINRAVVKLKRQKADAIVVMIHQGGKTPDPQDPQACAGLYGDILPIINRMDPRVDLVVSGHTHWAYVCSQPLDGARAPLLLTSAGVYGKLVTDITLDIDPASNAVVSKSARNVVVQSPAYGAIAATDKVPALAPDPAVAAYVKRYTDAAKAESVRPAGKLAGPAAGGVLANLIADAQLAATREVGAQVALMNRFGVRAPLTPAGDGALTFGDLYRAQPFDNMMVTQSFTGAELKAVLEQCFDGIGPEQALVPSAGFTYRYDTARAIGDRVTAIQLNGQPIDPAASYRVTTNSFLAQGGDSFTALTKGRNAVTGISDLAALEAWLKAVPARAVPGEERVFAIQP